MKKYIALLFYITFSFVSSAQEVDSLTVIYHYTATDGVMFKWLPQSQTVFEQGLKNGYLVSRAEVTIAPNGDEKLSEFKLLKNGHVKPWTKEVIKERLANDSSLIAAALLSSDEVQPRAANHQDAAEQSQGEEFKSFWRTFAALEKNTVATAMGLFYVDASIDDDTKYVYRFELANNPKVCEYVIVFPLKNYSPDKILGVKALVEPGKVTLSWNIGYENRYAFYNIYKSKSKDKKYQRINKKPFAGTVGSLVTNPDRVSMQDSITEFDQTYYYKVVGVNAFEKEELYSDPVQITTRYLLTGAPIIEDSKTLVGKDVEILWSPNLLDEPYILGYKVWHSVSGYGIYQTLNQKPLTPKTNRFIDKLPKTTSNYYKVCAYAKGGDSICSIFRSHLLVDSIPPTPPIIISGVCDTTGIVTLTWNKSPEKDVLGYRVFKTYYKNHEPIRVFKGYVSDTIAIDTISIKVPYNKIYYRVSAIDEMTNPSPPSEYFEVNIPDFKPPSSGFFTKYTVTLDGINLEWVNSSTYDLDVMYLLRKEKNEAVFDTILVMPINDLMTTYLDKDTKSDKTYTYALLAQDENGLFSELSNTYTIKQMDKSVDVHPSNLNGIANQANQMIKLSWVYPQNIGSFKIYRAKGSEKLSVYTFIKGTKREFYDTNLTPNTTYKYVIVAELPEGGESGFSNMIKVDY